MITAASNSRIKRLVQLNQKSKLRRTEDVFLAEGVKMFLEAPREQLQEVYVSESFLEKCSCREHLEEVGYEVVSDSVFSKISDTCTPQGVLCVLKQFHYNIEEMLRDKAPLFLLLENIQDPGNLGTMLRTGEGAGVSGIIMSRDTVDLYNPKVIRSTMGSIYRVPFYYADELEMKGAEVIFQDVHVSGHACQEEIKLIYTLVHPKYAIPVHGEYKHLKAQAGIAQELGIQKENIFILRSGNVLELNEEKAGVTGQVAAGAILVDGLGIGDVGNVVLRDRQHLAEDGIMIVVVALDSISGQIASGPDLVSRGFVYVKESDALMDEARDLMENVMEGCVSRGCTDWGRIKTAIKDNLGDFIWKKTKRRPMILPIIMEV